MTARRRSRPAERARSAARIAVALACGALLAGNAPRLAVLPLPAHAQSPIARAQAPAEPAARIYLPLSGNAADLSALPRPIPVTPAPTAITRPTDVPPTATEPAEPTPTATPTKAAPDYDEPLTDLASLDDLRAGYNAARWYETLLAILERRYATGRYIVTSLADSRAQAETWTTGQRDTFDKLLRALNVTVHEMNHQLGFQEGVLATRFQEYAFIVRADETRLVPDIDTFPRAEIAQYIVGPLENQYKSTYLTGQSGDQNFNTLLDEFNAYTHSLFVGYGIHDQLTGHSSHRDGLVTMMLYVEFFLRHARQHHPDDYAALRASPAVRDLVGLLWRRADFILAVTEDLDTLRLDPDAVESVMRQDDMLAEVADFVAEP